MNRVFLHLDMDAFFASVEQRDDPELRGKPVIIGADPKKGYTRGVVSTCSYEARKYGVRSAMPILKAYKLCPNGIFVSGNFAAYKSASQRLFEIMKRYSPLIQPLSIDEAFLDITGSLRLFGSVEHIIKHLKNDVWNELQLTCSIGVAPRKYLAKIASDYRKPNGYTIVEEETMLSFLAGLDISRMWGVGVQFKKKLKDMGIDYVGQLQKMSEEELTRAFGKMGQHLYRLSQGIDHRSVSSGREIKSVSKEHTFFIDVEDVELIKKWIYKLSEDVLRNARRKYFYGRTIQLKFRDTKFRTYTRSKTIHHECKHQNELYTICLDLLQNFLPLQDPVRLIGVGISHENENKDQLNLFQNECDDLFVMDLLKDKINNKFGKETLFGAEAMYLKNR